MPDVAGGLSFEYNLTGQNGQQITNLVLNAPTLLGIFTATINNWDNPAIAALNPELRLPNEPITSYFRSDPSGESYLLGRLLRAHRPRTLRGLPAVGVGEPGRVAVGFLGAVPGCPAAGPGRRERIRCRLARSRAHPRGDHLRRDRLREERRPAGGLGGQRGGCPRTAGVVQRRGGAHRRHPLLGPHPEPGWRLYEPQPERLPDLRLQLLRCAVRPVPGGHPELRVRQRGKRDHGHGAGGRAGPIHHVRGLPRPVQNGRARLFAHSSQPGRGRFPGRRTPARRRDAAGTERRRTATTPTSPGSYNHQATRSRSRNPTRVRMPPPQPPRPPRPPPPRRA